MRALPQALFQTASAAGPLGLVLAAAYAVLWEKTGFELSEPVLMLIFAAFTACQMWVQAKLKEKHARELAALPTAPSTLDNVG